MFYGNKYFHVAIRTQHDEVTGSCNHVFVQFSNNCTAQFIVDYGCFQEKDHQYLNREVTFINPEELDFALVTHVHADHIGRLPLLEKGGFEGSIFMSSESQNLLEPALEDNYKIMRSLSKREFRPQVYQESHIVRTIKRVRGVEYNDTITPYLKNVKMGTGNSIEVNFFKNGHLVGAALILVQIKDATGESINLLFTGDYKDNNMFFDVEELPKELLELPVHIVTESTYGDTDSSSVVQCFEENIVNFFRGVSEKSNKIAVIPVFSLGRAQEILYMLRRFQEEETLDINIPIYYDGKLSFRYTKLYQSGSFEDYFKHGMEDFLPCNLIEVDKEIRNIILYDNQPKIIVTTSGMGSYGPAQFYLPEIVSRKNAMVHFTGYNSEGTLGRRLMETEANGVVEIGGKVVKKRATILNTNEFSAHAKADELINFLSSFKRLYSVMINHGEEKVKAEFAKRILDANVNAKNVCILSRKNAFKIYPYGMVKSVPTEYL